MNARSLYSFGPYTLDADQMILREGSRVVALPPKALKTLLTLAEHNGDVVSKQLLMETVWPDSFVEEGNLTQNIFLLRRELGDDTIQTLPRRGYRLGIPLQTSAEQISSVDGHVLTQQSAPTPPAILPSQRPRRPARLAITAALLLFLVIAAGALLLWRQSAAVPQVSAFTQITHDGSIKRLIAAQLGGPEASLFSDGSRVYFTEGASDAPVIAQVSASGGETTVIPTPGIELPSLLDISPTHDELLVADSVDPAAPPFLWAVAIPGGTAHRLDNITASDASWSPDGHSLAFTRGPELFIASRDGGGVRHIATLAGNGWRPRWSPDSKQLRLTVFDIKSGTTSLWQVNGDGADLHPLLPQWGLPAQSTQPQPDPVQTCCGVWSPDGEDFVFQVTRQGRSEIWRLPAREPWLSRLLGHRLEPVRMTAGQLSSLSPAFSPDGRKLFVIGQQQRGELQRLDSRTGQFVPYLNGISANFTDFSRDGQWIAWVAYPDGTLWRSRIDGTEKLQLTFPPLEAMVPKWSPDGKQIVFDAVGGDRQRFCLIPSNGGTPRPVSPAGGEMEPSWSPDGTALMFSDFPFFVGKTAVHTININTGEAETLPGSSGFFSPQWSPDGKHATAMALDGARLMLFDFKTRQWSELANGWGLVHWSRDSQWAYFLRQGSDPAILRVRISDRHVEAVASLKGLRLTGRLAGLEFGLTPSGEPLITRDIGTQEVYSLDWNRH